MIETCFQVLSGRGQVRALRAALRPPWNASSLLIGRHRAPAPFALSARPPTLDEKSLDRVFTPIFRIDRPVVNSRYWDSDEAERGFEVSSTPNRIGLDSSVSECDFVVGRRSQS